jgi:hypothetical protein
MNSLPDPVQPTQANISIARTSLANLQRFNDLFYTYSISKCANAFLLLAKTDSHDPGMAVGINLLCGAILGVGSEFGFMGALLANYYCGLVSQYRTKNPPSLLAPYASYISRIQATTQQADCDMAVDYTDPTTNWYNNKSGTFDTPWGTKTLGCCLGQLATTTIPAETDPIFSTMMNKVLFSFDQMLWWTVLKLNFQINEWIAGGPDLVTYPLSKYNQAWINNYCKELIIKNPATNITWEIIQQRNFVIGKKRDYYITDQFTLGIAPIKGADQPISNAAANYLFIDSIPGDITNSSGLFNRAFLFNDCGINVVKYPV